MGISNIGFLSRSIVLAIATALLGACGSGARNGSAPVGPLVCAEGAPATVMQAMDAVTRSTDLAGNMIEVAMTVYQPELAEGECAPLIIQSHGFGGSRITDLADVADDATASDVATRRAWEQGYFVISFDQRGFGETEGNVMVMKPGFEGRDIQAVLDYAEDNLGGHLAYRDGNPSIGALGLSYGGGFQLIGAAVDPRFDAIVPSATWNHLPYSLSPNGAPKTVWLDLLILLGVTGAQGALDPFLYQGFLQAQLGFISDDILDEVRGNGLNSFCEGMRADGLGVPRVDAFLVQGANDTLFNMNEAVRNADCLRAAGNDVRLLVQRTGHILPLFQAVQGAFGFDVDPTVQCGGRNFETAERMLSFLDEKLRGQTANPPIDRVCIVQSDTRGITPAQVSVGGEVLTLPEIRLTTGPVVETVANVLDGLGSGLLQAIGSALGDTVDNLLNTLGNLASNPSDIANVLTNDVLQLLPPELLNELTAPSREVFLFTAQESRPLAGIPLVDLTLSGGALATDPIVFVGIGVRPAGGTRVELVNDQVAPLRGQGRYQQELVGITRQLEPGDEVYLLVYGFHNQYYLTFNKVPSQVSLSGSVSLPLP